MKEITTGYVLRVKGQVESLLVLTMLLLQSSVPFPRRLNWLCATPPSSLGWDLLSSGYTGTFS